MTIAFPCENCGHRFEVDASLAGRKCKCKKCDHRFLIPVPQSSSASAPGSLMSFGAETLPPKPRPGAAPAKKATSTPPAPSPDPYYAADDPYGFDDQPVPRRGAPAAAEDEEFLPPRGVKSASPGRKKKKKSGEPFLQSVPWWGYLAIAGVVGLLCMLVTGSVTGGLAVLVLVTSVGLLAVGSIGMMVVPFRESLACGLMQFLPIYGLYYLVTRWDDMKKWFGLSACGWALMMASSLLLPAITAARNAAQLARQRDLAARGGAAVAVSPGGDVETRIAEFNRTLEEMGGILRRVVDVPTALQEGPRHSALARRLQELNQVQGGNLDGAINGSGFLSKMSLNARYGAALKAASDRYVNELNRIKAMPDVLAALKGQPTGLASAGPFPGRRPRFGPGPRFGPPHMPPPPPVNPDEQLTLNVSGLIDKDTTDAFYRNLDQFNRTLNGGNGNSGRRSSGSGDRAVCVVWPVKDVQAFANGLNFATVTAVNGRTIDVTVPPASAPKESPFKKKSRGPGVARGG